MPDLNPKKNKKTTKNKKNKKNKKGTVARKKKTSRGKTSRIPRTRTVVREVPVFYTGTNVPFMPFQALDTALATSNLMGYMRGMVDGRMATDKFPPINPLLIPTNTRRSQRKSAPPRLQGDKRVAQQIVNDHFSRASRTEDARTSVFRDLRRDLGVIPQNFAL